MYDLVVYNLIICRLTDVSRTSSWTPHVKKSLRPSFRHLLRRQWTAANSAGTKAEAHLPSRQSVGSTKGQLVENRGTGECIWKINRERKYSMPATTILGGASLPLLPGWTWKDGRRCKLTEHRSHHPLGPLHKYGKSASKFVLKIVRGDGCLRSHAIRYGPASGMLKSSSFSVSAPAPTSPHDGLGQYRLLRLMGRPNGSRQQRQQATFRPSVGGRGWTTCMIRNGMTWWQQYVKFINQPICIKRNSAVDILKSTVEWLYIWSYHQHTSQCSNAKPGENIAVVINP